MIVANILFGAVGAWALIFGWELWTSRKRRVSQRNYFHFCTGCTVGTSVGRR